MTRAVVGVMSSSRFVDGVCVEDALVSRDMNSVTCCIMAVRCLTCSCRSAICAAIEATALLDGAGIVGKSSGGVGFCWIVFDELIMGLELVVEV